MAVIIDVQRIIAERFTAWAREWLEIPDEMYCDGLIRREYFSVIVGYLVEKGVFTISEIREEHKNRGIHVGADVYATALRELELNK